ncbi:MAG: hypothetical protein ACI4MT_05625 [Christensenellales bacterium]
MQSQNSVIKWILIILLVAICVTCFILCMTINNTADGTGGNAATIAAPKQIQGETNETEGTSNAEPEKEQETVYSTLPRNAAEFENYKVGHVGGTSSDVLKNAFCFGQSYFAVIETKSDDYDFIHSGIAIAEIKDNALIKTVVFAQNEEYIKSDLINGFLTVLTKTDKLNVYSISPTLAVTAKQEFDFDDALFIECTAKTLMFGIKGTNLYAYNYSAVKSVYLSKTTVAENSTLISTFKTDGGYAIFTGGNGLNLYSFNTEFNFVYSIDGEYLDSVLSNDYLAVITKNDTSNKIHLFSHVFNYVGVLNSALSDYAKFYPVQSGYLLITNNGYYNLCKHFDSLCYKAFEKSYDSIAVAINQNTGYILAQEENVFDIISFENFGDYKISDTINAKPLEKRIFATQNGFTAFFTNTTRDGIFSENFGDYETFWISYAA